MSYNGSGVFNINTAGQPVVTGTVISSTAFNALTADLATGLTTALTKDGQTTPTANIPMGGFKITGIAAATTLGDALSYGRAATVSTLTNSALTSGRVPYASTAGLLTDSANLLYSGTDLTVYGLTVGRGAGAVATNTVVGTSALANNSVGVQGTIFGYQAGNQTTGSYNDLFGYQAGYLITTGTENTGIGRLSMGASSAGLTGSFNVSVGGVSLNVVTSGAGNTGLGYQSLGKLTTGNYNVGVGKGTLYQNLTSAGNTAIGYEAANNTTGASNVAVGYNALISNTNASNNTAVGYQALYTNTAASNTAVGYQAGYGITTGAGNLFIGYTCNTEATTGSNNTCINALNGASRIFGLTTESNRVLVGYSGVTNAYVAVAWTVTSDARDKVDVTQSTYGLNFVNELKPVQYRWDRRSKYDDGHPDGSQKESKLQLGFLAQDVIELEKKYGAQEKDLLIADDEHDEVLKITETKMIPVLVKAIQEINARLTALESK